MNTETFQILDYATGALKQLAGLTSDYHARTLKNNPSIDAELKIRKGDKEHVFYVDVKKQVGKEYLHQVYTNNMNLLNKAWLVAAYYIPATVKAMLKENGINYIEATGNCFIDTKAIFVYINDQKSSALRNKTDGKLWKAAGLKFVFAVLHDPELLNKPYREIAHGANIALGMVGRFIQELQQEGYIREGQKDKKTFWFLERKNELIEKWSTLYNAVLKPKYTQGYFRPLRRRPSELQLDEDSLWGGEPAGENLTNYLQPETYTLYTWKPKNELLKELRLVPDNQGPIELITAFWNKETITASDQFVPPILVYADLIGSSDSRNHETAIKIKKQYLGS